MTGYIPPQAWSIRVASIVFALIVGGLLLLALGYSPLKAYGTIIDGSLGSKTSVRQTIKIAIPLLGCALAIAPCFKMHFWNIGAEGQITAGAIGATFFALKFGNDAAASAAAHHGRSWRALSPAASGPHPRLLQGEVEHERNAVHPDDELHHHRGRPLAAGRSVGGSSPGSQMIAQFAGKATLPSVLGVHCGWIIVLILDVS